MSPILFNHLIGECQKRRRHGDAKRSYRSLIDHEEGSTCQRDRQSPGLAPLKIFPAYAPALHHPSIGSVDSDLGVVFDSRWSLRQRLSTSSRPLAAGRTSRPMSV